jgi:hypothetical protein
LWAQNQGVWKASWFKLNQWYTCSDQFSQL